MSDEVIVDNLENFLPSWISDHLGELSYMEVVNEYPFLPKEDSSRNDKDPSMDTRPPPERETNTITQGEVAFYKAAFGVGLRFFPLTQPLRRILAFYNVYLAQIGLQRMEEYAKFGDMASSGGDNAEEKNVGNMAHIAANEAMSTKMVLKKLAQLAKKAKAKGDQKRARFGRKDLDSLGVVLGLQALAIDNPVVAKILLQGVILTTDKEMVGTLDLKHGSTRYFHALSQVGFYLIKKQISLLHLDLNINDIQIHPDLVDEYEEEEKYVPDATLL
ncbi:proline-rich extensin-like family protein [Actinidia rufa]|uniref:Proline-rich extensin-like family protein n=1 Tax=Actinidia rufa TaxID=165716 RepID=A0A7J0GKP6_9ERIC|nr:proline-rich extensin-like family protein [Actinidia rufa]